MGNFNYIFVYTEACIKMLTKMYVNDSKKKKYVDKNVVVDVWICLQYTLNCSLKTCQPMRIERLAVLWHKVFWLI